MPSTRCSPGSHINHREASHSHPHSSFVLTHPWVPGHSDLSLVYGIIPIQALKPLLNTNCCLDNAACTASWFTAPVHQETKHGLSKCPCLGFLEVVSRLFAWLSPEAAVRLVPLCFVPWCAALVLQVGLLRRRQQAPRPLGGLGSYGQHPERFFSFHYSPETASHPSHCPAHC